MTHTRPRVLIILLCLAAVGAGPDAFAQTFTVSEPQKLDITPDGYHQEWSPDGQTLAYVAGTWPDIAIHIAPIGGGVGTKIETGLTGDYYISWHPDGEKLAFDCYGPGTEQLKIWTVGVDGSDLFRVSQNNVIDMQPVWSPDGTRILFASNRYGSQDQLICDPDGRNVVRFTNHTGSEWHSEWSPDGEYIIFSTERYGASDLCVKNVAGGPLRRVTDNPAWDDRAAWSPDGQWIAFTSDRGGTRDIWIVPSEGGEPIQLTFSEGNATMATWSPDSRSIVYVDDGFWRIDLDFGTPTVRTSHGGLRATFR